MKANILGVQIDVLTKTKALEQIERFLSSDRQHQVVTANPEMVLQAWRHDGFRRLINNSSLVVADGIGLLWAAKFLALKSSNFIISLCQLIISSLSLVISPDYCRQVLPERITGVDLLEKICEQASRKNWKVYLLGGAEGIAEKTSAVLKKRYLELKIVGADHGYELLITNDKLQPDEKNNQPMVSRINQQQPDILLVAFGALKQEYWIKENLSKLTSVKVAMGVGGAFDFIAGRAKRAPEIYRELGLEWLHRFCHQPWRATRMFNATLRFIYRVSKYKHHLG